MPKAVASSLTGAGVTNGTYASANMGAVFGALTPAVPPSSPAAGSLVPNGSGQIVTVVVTGGTMTNVSVNGSTVGAGAGTYTLPPSVRPGDGISMTYSVAPTWAWSVTPGFTGDVHNSKPAVNA